MTATPTRSTAAVWRPGDPVGDRRFAAIGDLRPRARRRPARRHRRLRDVGHALAVRRQRRARRARPHRRLATSSATPGPGHASPGWWPGLIGPGAPLDTDRLFVVASNVLGGCQGTHRAGVRRPRRASLGRPVPVHHDPRPGRRRGRARRRARHPALARRARRVDGRHAGARVGGGPPRPGRAGPRAGLDALRHGRPGRVVPAAAARHPVRPGLPRRRLLRPRRVARHRHGHRPADRAHDLPARGRARRPVRPPAPRRGRTRSAEAGATTSRATSTTTPPSSPGASTRTATSCSPRR